VYPAQGPGGETSVKARNGHHAHATAWQRLAVADACCGRAARRRTVRVASVEMALSLSLPGVLWYIPYTTHETNHSGLNRRF